jgi:hypothetical protein
MKAINHNRKEVSNGRIYRVWKKTVWRSYEWL